MKECSRETFLWGVATSAFQLEGSPHADWSSWDTILSEKPKITNHYELYRKDLSLLHDLGVNAYRFSLEWSRIQPHEHTWDDLAIEHYVEIIDILIKYRIEPMLTLHHFTHPLWFIKKYPWHEDESVDIFLAYVKRIVAAVKNVKYWITFNEPYVLILAGYFEGCIPPAMNNVPLGIKALVNILKAHAGAYEIIHAAYPDAEVSVAHNMAALAPWSKWNPLDKLLARFARSFYNQSLLDAFRTGLLIVKFPLKEEMRFPVPIKGKLDFFGVNYYTRIHMRFNPLKKMGVEMRHLDIDGHGLTDMGWEIYPRGLEKMLKFASTLNVPLIITENGIATRDSHKKIRFIKEHIDSMEHCKKKHGLDIRGYFYWSLIDNYEWLNGLDARFGLYNVNFETLERKPTSAATYYSYIIKNRKF
ncbi:MAG: family 1 glycosylhydrolase [Nitrospirae bacterium]|nr:family 1 glycosylhydrolase [Nitrospirota bacterium]MBF0533412.1 family 1 glycosylhydrolase [Nitrospirota bacterium]MBF0616062.1 family 1 glycosylhydrolase [Nitrospirota bacterium]